MVHRWLAGQFARPSGRLGRLVVAPWLDRLSPRMNAATFEQLSVKRGDRVLEAGFGGGALLAALLDAGAEVIGVEPSEAMIDRARKRFGQPVRAGRLRLFAGSMQALLVGDASIDALCSVNNLYFWPDPPAAMVEAARVLRPGGRLILCFQSAQAVRAWPGHVHGFAAYDESAVRGWMGDAGFASLRATYGADPKLGDFICLVGLREPA